MTLKDDAYRYIKQEIILNHFHPKQIISENQIADDLAMSRTPVREALKQLGADGLVVLHGRENIVAPITDEMIDEVRELRTLLEKYALTKTISLIPSVKLDELADEFKQAAKVESWEEYLSVDTKFHTLITHLNGHDRLQQFLMILQGQTDRIRRLSTYDETRMENSLQEHLRLIDLIKNQDLIQAENELEIHLQHVYHTAHQALNYFE